VDTLVLAARVALSLAVVLGVLWFLQRRVSRSTRVKRAASAVAVVARQGIGPKASVVVVDVEGTRYLLGVTEQSVTLLSSGQTPSEPAALAAVTPAALEDTRDAGRPVPASANAFARALHAESASSASNEDTENLPLRRPRDRASRSGAARVASGGPAASASPLAGSILSGATWRQAGTALRQRRAG
jgi:flagellar protein FliO/FliZ